MPINLGDLSVENLKVGDKPVKTVFLGEDFVLGELPPPIVGGTETFIEQNRTVYKLHTFESTDSLQVRRDTDVEYLLVAGGGGGGISGDFRMSGGGGAGGMLKYVANESDNNDPFTIPRGSYSLQVGQGGDIGESGGNTELASLIAVGGGFGGIARIDATGIGGPGGDGGSGGGSGPGGGVSPAPNAGVGIEGQGNDGSRGRSGMVSERIGGGGGGAGTAAPETAGTVGGAGGDGLSTAITGETEFYAGGGGGAGSSGSGIGGIGGGGDGGREGADSGQSGVPGTGGGGGGSRNGDSGSGGSGIAVIRYPVDAQPFLGTAQQPISIVTDQLKVWLDGKRVTSYPGTGSTLFDISQGTTDFDVQNADFDSDGFFEFVRGSSPIKRILGPSVAQVTDFSNTDDYTVEFWMKPDPEATAGQNLITKVPGTGYPYQFRYLPTTTQLSVLVFDGTRVSTRNVNIDNTVWTHVVGTFDNTNDELKLYVNGQLALAPRTMNMLNTTSNNSGVNIGQDYTGVVSSLRIYAKALSAQEVSQNYEATAALHQ